MRRIITIVFVCVFFFSGGVQATLFSRGEGTITNGGSGDYNLIYDDVLDITWIDYTSPASNWNNQNSWANNLVVSYAGEVFDDWRLPHVLPVNGSSYNYSWSRYGSSDIGFNISAPGSTYPGSTGSEMANLFYGSLGNYGAHDIYGRTMPSWESQNTSYFNNLEAGRYWSETLFGTSNAFWFEFGTGAHDKFDNKDTTNYRAIAVHNGDVPLATNASPVPEPATMLLLGTGLGGLLVIGRKKRIADSIVPSGLEVALNRATGQARSQ